MKVLGVIPARGGSTRIPRKNLEYLGQFPLVHHACNQLAKTDWDWIVSTDDAGVAMHVMSWFGSVRVGCRNRVGDGPMAPVLVEAVEFLPVFDLSSESPWADVVVCVQPTSPFRLTEDIEACVDCLEGTPGARSVVSIDESTGLRNGAVFVTRVSMLRDGLVYDEHSLKYPMPHDRSVDINTPEDLELARRLWKERHG